ncbi:alpha/beta hydrolase family protein [Brevibacterium sp. UBA7493]|uniref:alpha/beta hydrolase family protein n=1 Tax=Brevibacterium sp. UBA7493 TaxID=1946121 RepID=UPI0025794D48|nr:S9 family peptidase [Brevibacterium sp. UBA7493]
MKPADITSLISCAEPVSAGERILCQLTRPDVEANSYRSQYVARQLPVTGTNTAGATGTAGEWTRLSHGWNDSALTITDDSFGFLRAVGPKESPQLYIGATGAEARRLTDAPLGVSGFAFDPSGQRAVYLARTPEEGRYGTDEDISADAEAPRHITAASYLSDGLGYGGDRLTQLFSVDLTDPGMTAESLLGSETLPESVQLTEHAEDVSDPQFSPAGQLSVVAGLEQPTGDVDLRSHLWLITDDGMERIDLGMHSAHAHVWLDEDRIAFIGIEHRASVIDFVAALPGLFIHDRSTGQTTRITCDETIELEGIRPVIADGCAYVVLTVDGSQRAARIPLDAGTVTLTDGELTCAEATAASGTESAPALLSPPELVVTGLCRHGEQLIVTAATVTSPGEIFAIDAAGGLTQLSDFATQLVDEPLAVTTPQAVSATTPLGDVHGWVAIPEGEGPFPVVLNIHGGPFSQYTEALFDETQVLTRGGYAVVYANPRGSNGRGRAWGQAVQGDMAAPAHADVLEILDAALAAHPQLDGSRLGIQGGSYGGYLTAMILNAEDRFAAGIVERGYLDPTTFIGTSDIGRFFSEEYSGRDPERIAAQSPMTDIEKNTTPTLVIHSERDFRCPLEQAQRYYAALQRAGTHAELLIFPGESHGLSRTGQPRHRVQRFEHMLTWWSTHLRT